MRLARFMAAFSLALLIVGGLVHATPQSGAAAKSGPPQAPAGAPPATAPAAFSDRDAGETRGELEAVLRRYPPSVSRVLKTDTSLLSNASHLSSHPALA